MGTPHDSHRIPLLHSHRKPLEQVHGGVGIIRVGCYFSFALSTSLHSKCWVHSTRLVKVKVAFERQASLSPPPPTQTLDLYAMTVHSSTVTCNCRPKFIDCMFGHCQHALRLCYVSERRVHGYFQFSVTLHLLKHCTACTFVVTEV